MSNTFAGVFDSSPQLAQLNDSQRMSLLNKAYDMIKDSGKADAPLLRKYRDAQKQTLYDYDVASGATPQGTDISQWEELQRGGMTSAQQFAGMFGVPVERPQVSEERKALFRDLEARDIKADLLDIGKVATDWSHYPKAVAKFGTDLFGLATSTDIGRTLTAAALTPVYGPRNAAKLAEIGPEVSSSYSKVYEDAIKGDPDLYKMYDAAVVDGLLGSVFGVGRATKLAAGASKATVARNFMAPIVSNVVGGQVIYHGLEALDKQLDDTDLSDSAKTGIRIGALIAGGLASGFTIEPAIERAIAGSSKTIRAAEKVGEAAKRVRSTEGKTFQQDLLDNPDIEQDLKELLIGSPSLSDPSASKFDPQETFTFLDELESAQAKVKAGAELTQEESEALAKVGSPALEDPTLTSEEISQVVGPLSERKKLEASRLEEPALREEDVLDEGFNELGPETETKEAFRARIAEGIRANSRQSTPEPSHPIQSPKAKPEPEASQVIKSPEQRAEEAIEEGRQAKTLPKIDLLTRLEAAQGATGMLPYSKGVMNQRGVATIDALTAKARELQALQKTLPEQGREDLVQAIPAMLEDIKAEVRDVHTALALANNGTGSLLASLDKEIRGAKKELVEIVKRGKAAQGEEKTALRARYREIQDRIKILEDRKIVLQRPAATGKKENGIPSIVPQKSAGEVVSKAAERIERGDALTRLAELPDTTQLKVRQVSEAISKGMENLLGRSLSEEENLDVLARVLSNSEDWGVRKFSPASSPLRVQEGMDDAINMGYVEGKYPTLARLLSMRDPEVFSTETLPIDTLLGTMQGLVARSGIGTDQKGYSLMREVMKESFDLWDEVKGGISSANPTTVESFLSTASLNGVSEKMKTKLVESLNEAFPELMNSSVTGRALPKTSSSFFDALTKVLGVSEQADIGELMHELGHLNFYYLLDADTKLDWLDSMRRFSGDESSWAQAFPGYAKRQQALEEAASQSDAAKEAFWMTNPAELYAEQFRAYMLSNVIPPVDTLSTFERATNGLKAVLGASYDEFSSLAPEARQAILKVMASPSPIEARKISLEKVEELAKDNWLFIPRDEALMRVEEIEGHLDEVYSGRLVELDAMETSQIDKLTESVRDGVSQVPIASYTDIPVPQRVLLYSLEDLQDVIEMQSLKNFYDLPGADLEELQMAQKRLDTILMDSSRADLVEKMVRSRLPRAGKFGDSVDVQTGERYGSGAEWAAQQREWNRQERDLIWNRLDKDVQQQLTISETMKFRARRAQAEDAIDAELKAEKRIVSKEERERLIDALLSGDLLEDSSSQRLVSTALDKIKDSSYNELWHAERNAVLQELAATDTKAEALRQLANCALAKAGKLDVIEPDFLQRLSYADSYSRVASQDSIVSTANVVKTAARLGYCGFAGLEYDPEGMYIPWLGTVRWNPEKFNSSPFNYLFLPLPYSKIGKSAKLAGRLAKRSVPKGWAETFDSFYKTAARTFGPNSGIDSSLIDIISQAKNYGAQRKTSLVEFGETFVRHFTPAERKVIARMVEKGRGWEHITAWAGEKRPDILLASQITDRLLTTIREEFERLGVTSGKFADVQGNYLDRYFRNIERKSISGIFRSYNITPLRMEFLKHKGVMHTIKNTHKDGVVNSAFSLLKQQAEDYGIELVPGLRINAWQTPSGLRVYSIPGTAYDDSLRSGKEVEALYTWDKPYGGLIVEEVGRGQLKLQRDFTPAERKAMGEVTDVSVRLAAMGERMEQDYRRAFLYKTFSDNSFSLDLSEKVAILPGTSQAYPVSQVKQWAIDNGWKQISQEVDPITGVPKYGALSGRWVSKDVWETIMLSEQSFLSKALNSKVVQSTAFGKILKAHSQLLRAWKLTKTAYSPVSHMNNFLSNAIMGYFMGHNTVAELLEGYKVMRIRSKMLRSQRLLKEKKYAEQAALIEEAQKDPYWDYYQEIREARMSDSTQWSSEMRADELANDLLKRVDEETNPGLITSIGHSLAVGAKALGQQATRAYENGDLVYKMGAFIRARKQGKDINEALRYAYEAYFDYGQLAPGVRFLRDSGIVPFVSYVYKAIPALLTAVREHPQRFISAALALEAIHLTNIAGAYGTDEPLKVSEALDAALPTYMQGRGFGGTLRTRLFTGLRDNQTDKGVVQTAEYLDLSRILPGSDLYETSEGFGNVSDIDISVMGVGELLNKVLMQSPVISQIVFAGAKKNLSLGQEFQDGGDIDSEAVRDRAQSQYLKGLWNSLIPNLPFVPYSYSQDSLIDGLVGNGVIGPIETQWLPGGGRTGLDSLGVAKPWTTVAGAQIGIKVRSIQPERTLAYRAKSDQFELAKEKSRLRKVLRSPRLTQEAKQSEIEDFQQTAQEYSESQRKRAEFLARLRDAHGSQRATPALVH